MNTQLQLQHRLEQKMKLAPQIIMSIEILQLPALELSSHISQELLENPALEIEEVSAEAVAEQDTSAESELSDEFERALDAMEEYDREWSETIPKVSDGAEAADRKLEAMNNTAARPVSLQDYVVGNYHLLELPLRIKDFGEYLIFDLDENGMIQYDLEEIRADYNKPRLATDPFMAVSKVEAERALRALQELRDPPGIGARDARECLLLQLDSQDPELDLKRLLILNHLEDIQKNRLPRIERATGRERDVIKQAIKDVHGLSLNPGSSRTEDLRVYVQPDVIVEYREGEYEIILENSYLPPLRISKWVRQLMEKERAASRNGQGGLTKEEKQFVMGKYEGARRLIDAIQQRQNTLERVARVIFRHQRPFLDGGLSELRPLKMSEVADELGVHVSTVSRAIADKWAQTPRGIFPLKFFFTGGTETEGGESVSRISVKQLVQKIVDGEDKESPLSDEDIAKALREHHELDIARRTVTKYRKQLKIPSSRQRREY